MKNRIIFFLLYIFCFSPSLAENLNIQSLNITIDKKTKTTIFQNQVSAKDEKNNQLLTEFAEYNKNLQLFKTVGKTTVLTSGGFVIEGDNIIFDNNKNYIKSNSPANIRDVEKKIYRVKKQLFYFSFICKTPIELNNPIVITGIHTANDKEILLV